MATESIRLDFRRLRRVTGHLRRGGTIRGACGWAGIDHRELELRLREDQRLAQLMERAESLGLARDERRLEGRVEDGDPKALLFRLKAVYGYGNQGGRGELSAERADEPSREYGEVVRRIAELGREERRGLVAAYREAAIAGA